MENKITIEITAEGWKIDVTIDDKTYTERYIGDRNKSECIEGDFENEEGIPQDIYDALNDFFLL